jgi:hypothetical protein
VDSLLSGRFWLKFPAAIFITELILPSLTARDSNLPRRHNPHFATRESISPTRHAEWQRDVLSFDKD